MDELQNTEMAESSRRDSTISLVHSSSSEHRTSLIPVTDCELGVPSCSVDDERVVSPAQDCIRPCYYLLQILGMWRPRDNSESHVKILREMYHVLVLLLWLASLAAVMAFWYLIQPDIEAYLIWRDVIISVANCLILLCPFVFTKVYLKRGQFTELVFSVQNISAQYTQKLRRRALFYTWTSITLWSLSATFFVFLWMPFFSNTWKRVVVVIIIVYITGWWAVWLSIYVFVCDVHRLQIDALIESTRSNETSPVQVLCKQQQVRNALQRTQKDLNFIISFAVSYHAISIVIRCFIFFHYYFVLVNKLKLWQFTGGILLDLVTILIKLVPPAAVAAAVHRSVNEAAKRCDVTPLTECMPEQDMKLLQYMVNCQHHMGLKVLGIRITAKLVGTVLMSTIITAGISFVAFVVPRLTYKYFRD